MAKVFQGLFFRENRSGRIFYIFSGVKMGMGKKNRVDSFYLFSPGLLKKIRAAVNQNIFPVPFQKYRTSRPPAFAFWFSRVPAGGAFTVFPGNCLGWSAAQHGYFD
jgi:hypothetical protein